MSTATILFLLKLLKLKQHTSPGPIRPTRPLSIKPLLSKSSRQIPQSANWASLWTAAHENIAVVWVVMNNNAFGTIAGLEKAHYGTTFGTVFEKEGKATSPDYASIARAYGIESVKIQSAEEFKPALQSAIASNKPVLIDVPMINNPVPTGGHWNILDIYSPGKKISHVST